MEFYALLLIIVLPFLAGLAAVLLPSDSRTPVTWLAGATTAACLALTISLYPSVSSGSTVRHRIEWIPSLGLDFTLQDGRLCLDVRVPGQRDRLPRRASTPAITCRPRIRSAASILFFLAFMGVDARHRPLRQPGPAGRLLGTHQHLLLPADRLLASQPGGARRRPHGADDNRHRRPGAAGRRPRDRPHRRQLRPRRRAGVRRRRYAAITSTSRRCC